jgi:class 3 adenylate cyclase
VLAARHLQAPVMQVVLWDGEAHSGPAGTAANMKVWNKTGLPQRVLHLGNYTQPDDLSDFDPDPTLSSSVGREIRAMLFGDMHGFSKLTDSKLSFFAEKIMGPMGEVIRRYQGDLSFVNTWGDGIFAVFTDPGRAVACALELQASMKKVDLEHAGLPPHLQLRVGAHLGPSYELWDPVLERLNYYGAHVSRAARIEPITPPGCVYVTETFAAVLALKHASEFTCDYVGFTKMAKHYGLLRMFLLRRSDGANEPVALVDIGRPPLK